MLPGNITLLQKTPLAVDKRDTEWGTLRSLNSDRLSQPANASPDWLSLTGYLSGWLAEHLSAELQNNSLITWLTQFLRLSACPVVWLSRFVLLCLQKADVQRGNRVIHDCHGLISCCSNTELGNVISNQILAKLLTKEHGVNRPIFVFFIVR